MRIPVSKVYRAFPELDRFSDAECEGFVRLAKSQYMFAGSVAVFVGLLMGGVVGMAGVAVTILACALVRRSGFGITWDAETWVHVAGLSVSFLAAWIIAMMWCDRWLKRTILVRLMELRCPGCSYSLLGLEIVSGGIVCPECGQRFDLAERGLTAADVLAQSPGGAGA